MYLCTRLRLLNPLIIIERGRTNEYKVGYYPHRALVTAADWLRQNVVVTMPCSISITLLTLQASEPV